MKTIYVVLPFTGNYGRPITSKLRTFTTRKEALQYANEWYCVELITTKL